MRPFNPSSEMIFLTVEADFNRFVEYLRSLKEKEFRFDLAEVKRCDSAGLALLVTVKKQSILANKICYFTEITPSIKSLAELCGVGELLIH